MTMLPSKLTLAIVLSLMCGAQGNYALGEAAPMCWKLDAANTPVTCPPGLEIDWHESAPLPGTFAVSMPVLVKVGVKISMATLDELKSKDLLSSNASLTAAEKWDYCTTPQAPCADSSDKDRCCYFHVNVHSCLDKPGTFCGPWLGNDGHLATHTPAFSSSAGTGGQAIFDFNVKLFWEGRYTIIAHFKFAGIHFAIGRSSTVSFSDALCPPPLVPDKSGACEHCPAGSQPLSAGIPKGGSRLTDVEAIGLGVNPLCVPCPPGFYSAAGEECLRAAPGFFTNSSWETEQQPCPAGTSNPLFAMTGCIDCQQGQFSSQGAAQCQLCQVGRYSDEVGTTSCTSCPGRRTTESMGTTSLAECVCPAGSFAGLEEVACLNCPEGMECPIASSVRNFGGPSGAPVPLLRRGYFSEPSAPLDVYRCHAETGPEACPGGSPGSCAGARLGLACAQCPEGHAPQVDGGCSDCGSKGPLAAVIASLAVLVVVVVAYYVCNDAYRADIPNTLAISSAGSIMVMTLQVLSFMPMLAVVWPRVAAQIMGVFAFFRLSPDSVTSTACFSQGATGRFFMQCLPPFVVVGSVVVCFVISRFLGQFVSPGWRWDMNKALNTMFMILQTLFVGIALIVTAPFQCYSHPAATEASSMSLYPEVLCWGSEHGGIIGLAVVVLVLFVAPFVSLCTWVMVKAYAAIHANDEVFLARFRFMIFRYRPERSWWGFAFIIRMLLYSMTPLIPADFPHVQLLFMSSISFVYLVLVGYFWPWKSHELSVFDALVGLFLGMICTLSAAFVEKPQDEAPYEVLLFVLMTSLLLIFLAIIACIVYWAASRGIREAFGFWPAGGVDVKDLQQAAKGLTAQQLRSLVELCALGEEDRAKALQRTGAGSVGATEERHVVII